MPVVINDTVVATGGRNVPAIVDDPFVNVTVGAPLIPPDMVRTLLLIEPLNDDCPVETYGFWLSAHCVLKKIPPSSSFSTRMRYGLFVVIAAATCDEKSVKSVGGGAGPLAGGGA